MSYPRVTILAFVVSLIWSPVPATAQPLGVFRWQLLPFCNVITLNVTQLNGAYTLDGTEDRCGAAEAASADGIAFLNPNGTVGFGITTVLPGGAPLHLEAAISIASLGGTWRDSAGNSGTLVLTPGASSGGAPRPISVAIPAGSITAVQLSTGAVGPAALANGAVGSSALAENSVTGTHIVNGTVTSADLATGAVGALAIAADAINGVHIVDASITGAELANGAVGPSALAVSSVTGAHIVDLSVTGADLALNSVAGAHIVDASVTGADLAAGAVGAAAIAPDSVTGDNVLNGSLTILDIGDAPRLESVEDTSLMPLPSGVPTIIAQIPVIAPAIGRVLVNASGTFAFDNATSVDEGYCSITTAMVVSAPHAGIAIEGTGSSYLRVPFGGTRAFSVAAGSSTTFRLVCVANGTNVGILSPILTALFVAGS